MAGNATVLESVAHRAVGGPEAWANRTVTHETVTLLTTYVEHRHDGDGSNLPEAFGPPTAIAEPLPTRTVKPWRHQMVEILTDPAVVRIGWLAFGISIVCLSVTALL